MLTLKCVSYYRVNADRPVLKNKGLARESISKCPFSMGMPIPVYQFINYNESTVNASIMTPKLIR